MVPELEGGRFRPTQPPGSTPAPGSCRRRRTEACGRRCPRPSAAAASAGRWNNLKRHQSKEQRRIKGFNLELRRGRGLPGSASAHLRCRTRWSRSTETPRILHPAAWRRSGQTRRTLYGDSGTSDPSPSSAEAPPSPPAWSGRPERDRKQSSAFKAQLVTSQPPRRQGECWVIRRP